MHFQDRLIPLSRLLQIRLCRWLEPCRIKERESGIRKVIEFQGLRILEEHTGTVAQLPCRSIVCCQRDMVLKDTPVCKTHPNLAACTGTKSPTMRTLTQHSSLEFNLKDERVYFSQGTNRQDQKGLEKFFGNQQRLRPRGTFLQTPTAFFLERLLPHMRTLQACCALCIGYTMELQVVVSISGWER